MGPEMWLITSEELLVEQSSEFVLCSTQNQHFNTILVVQFYTKQFTTALTKGVIHFSDYLSRKEAQIQDTG